MVATDKNSSLIESQRFNLKTVLFLITIFYPFSFNTSVGSVCSKHFSIIQENLM